MKVSFSSSFKKSYRKLVKGNRIIKSKFWDQVEIFIKDPYDNRLKTHQLSGKLNNLWSFRVQYNISVIFFFKDTNNAVFVDIGKHDEVY